MQYNYPTHGSPLSPSDKSHRSSTYSQLSAPSSWGTIHSVQSYPQVQDGPPATFAPLFQTVPLPNEEARSPYSVSGVRAPPLIQICPAFTDRTTMVDLSAPNRFQVKMNPGSLATYPAVQHLTLVPPSGLPQSWAVHISEPNGVTIQNILDAIYRHFQIAVSPQECAQLPSRSNATAAFNSRTQHNQNHYTVGIKRLDFLGGPTVIVGISFDGQTWRLHLDPVYNRSQN